MWSIHSFNGSGSLRKSVENSAVLWLQTGIHVPVHASASTGSDYPTDHLVWVGLQKTPPTDGTFADAILLIPGISAINSMLSME
jgi:hypothetical protein